MGVRDESEFNTLRNNSFAIGVLIGILIMTAFILITDDDPATEEVDTCTLCIDQKPEE